MSEAESLLGRSLQYYNSQQTPRGPSSSLGGGNLAAVGFKAERSQRLVPRPTPSKLASILCARSPEAPQTQQLVPGLWLASCLPHLVVPGFFSVSRGTVP